MAEALDRIAAALERLAALEERREERARRRRRDPVGAATVAEPAIDEFTMRRASELLTKRGLGRVRSTPGARRKARD